MCISAGQRIGRTEIFSGRLLTEVREVSFARRNLDPIIEASTFRVGATPFNSPLTAIPNTISFADSAFANPETLMCEMPPLPVLIPPLPELEQEQPATLELPPFQLSDLREYFSVITFLTPGSAIKSPLSEPEDEARVTIGDEEELRTVLQAIGPEISTTAGVLIMFVGIPSLLGIVFGAAYLIEMSHKKKLQLERGRREALRTLLLDQSPHTASLNEMKSVLHDTQRDGRIEALLQNLTILTNSAAYQNPEDPEHAKVLVRVLVTRRDGLNRSIIHPTSGMRVTAINPDIHGPAAAQELGELQQLVTTPEFESSYADYMQIAADFEKLGIKPQIASEAAPARIDHLRERAAAQRAQEAGSPVKAKAGKPE